VLTISDPCELKAADIYRQARTVASKTSRATDGNWYRGPEELPCQWHIWFDGGRDVCSAIYSRQENKWQPGPELPLANLTTAEGVSELMGEFLSTSHFSQPPKALGVILHIADEFALAEISQGTENADSAEDLGLLRYNLIDEPKEVLADREVSLDTTTWRLLPFWGAPAGQPRSTAVALSRSREAFLQELLACGEAMRLPVRVAVTSAAVEALAAMPLIRPSLSGGCLVAVQYLKYTAVFAVNAVGELRTVRTLSHRGGLLVPASFGDILWNMAIGAELAGPDAGPGQPKVYLVSADKRSLEAAQQDLEIYSLSRQKIYWEVVDLAAEPSLAQVPGHRLEFLNYDPHVLEQVRQGETPLAKTETFTALWTGWASQSYFDTGKLDNRYPTLRDLRLLRLSTWFVYLLSFALLSSAGYGTYSLFAAMNHPSWQLTPEQVKLTQGKHTKLTAERKQIDLTKRLLLPRSRGWVTLEFLLQLFPEDSGVRLDSFDYSMESARPAPVSGGKKGATPEYTGITRKWSFKGLVKPKAMELLSEINSQRGLKALFDRVAAATGDESYKPDPERQLTVTLTQGRNSRFDAQAGAADLARDPTLSYPFNFEATITQSLSAKDALAMPIQKPF
jgi:hypothetical protein